ncbi:hypothetical protein AVANS_1246 [Campylobacter sp. RM5004]|uniref:hypothetical protein n=1 Tax=Campylobacter sp. RM5004 TaxID=1660078 RepID=UPI001EFBDFDC|nr:hypothetical protein [Campylobacter sp. RM5004]ULO01865.1 hypothetical protein AVANS_1246 [Campylobacter sp. RM5004]
MLKKNLTLYSLGACAVVLGGIYFTIPSTKKEEVVNTKPVETKVEEQKTTNIKLPKLEEQNYKILNDRIVKLTRQLESIKNSSTNADEIKNLYQEIEKLKTHNEQLETKNNELVHRLNNESLLVNENNKISFQQMIDKLNEDLANYKSENDSLKLSLNDKENAVKNLNSLLGTLSNQKQMDEFEHDNLARKLQDELDKANAKIVANQKNYTDVVKENDVLKQRVKNLENLESVNTELSKTNNDLNLKNLELSKEIKAANKLNEELKSNNNSDFVKLNLDNKNLQAKLDDAKTSILKLNQVKDDLEQKLSGLKNIEKQRDELKNEVFQAKLELEKTKNEQTKAIKELSDKNQKSLDNLTKELNKVSETNVKLQEKNTKTEVALKDIELKNKDLELNIKKKEKDLNEALAKLNKIDNEFNTTNSNNKDLKAKLDTLQKEKIDLTTQLNKINNEFLKYKNDSLNNKQNDIKSLNDKLFESSKAYDELNAKYIALKEDLTAKELELNRNKQEKTSLENEIEQLKLAISKDTNSEKVIALEEEKDKLLKQLNELNLKTLNNYNQENNELIAKKEKIQELEKKLELAQKGSSLNTASLKLQDTFICDDIKSGVIGLSKTCSLALDKFLSKYNQNYLYEITPIIDDSGFKSLSAIDGVHMATKEVQRLTRLANFGLSKDRTKSAANYIKSKVPNALISSSLEPEYSKDNKKGFILRVYK